jgi:hypothetical protein
MLASQDRMVTMAVLTGSRFLIIVLEKGHSMDTLTVLEGRGKDGNLIFGNYFRIFMATATSFCNMVFTDSRITVIRGFNLVFTMTVGTDRNIRIALLGQFPMYTSVVNFQNIGVTGLATF